VIAFKWLAKGAVAPFTGFRWPQDGSWVSAPPGAPEGSGVHACRIADLAYWIGDELWRAELQGAVVERETQVEAPRGRLLQRIAEWSPDAFRDACVARITGFHAEVPTPELADYLSLAKTADAAVASFVAAVAAVAARGARNAFEEERAWQSQWLARALQLRED
jgi:hypothetical protein